MALNITEQLQIDTDPAGMIGLLKRGAAILLRFDEADDSVLPSDATGTLADMNTDSTLVLPTVVWGVSGYAREFVAASGHGLVASDVVAGDTLFNRDVSVQALLRWDIADQNTYGSNGTIISRGKTGDDIADYVAFGLELRVVNIASRLGEIRWFWQETDGTMHTCTGGQFTLTADSATMLLTATRRWVSSTEVVVRYYAGDRLLAESTETVGDIGGGTTGRTTIGARSQGSSYSEIDLSAGLGAIAGAPGTGTPISLSGAAQWNAVLRSPAEGGGAITVSFACANDALAPTSDVRDGYRWNATSYAWDVLAGNVSILVNNNDGTVTVADVEAMINANSSLLQVSTADTAHASNTFVETEIIPGFYGDQRGTTSAGANLYENHLDGAIDELRVVDSVLSHEEIENTWRRLKLWQPLGEQLARDTHPPGWPFSMDPDSSIGMETRLYGYALGLAAAAAENMRANMMPDRAYGRVLERWEEITRQPPLRYDSIEERRLRVLGHLRARSGVSPAGVRSAIGDLLDVADTNDISILSFSNTQSDDFASLLTLRWRAVAASVWSAAGTLNAAEVSATQFGFENGWATCLTGNDGPEQLGCGFGTELFAKLSPTTLPSGAEFGLLFYDQSRHDAFMFGVKYDGANYKVVSERVIAGVSQGQVEHATTSLTDHWLHLLQEPYDWTSETADAQVPHTVRWSTTSAIAGFSEVTSIDFSLAVGWLGFYARTTAGGTLSGNISVNIDDATWRCPHGRRPYHFYAYVDPLDTGGAYDLDGANAVLRRLKQSHTHAAAITSLSCLCDDEDSGAGLGPCGGF